MAETKGLLTYNQQSTITEARSLEWFTTVSSPVSGTDAGRTVVTFYANFSDDAVPQNSEVAIDASVPAADTYYTVTIDRGAGGGFGSYTQVRSYTFLSLQSAANTAATIATELARLINTHPDLIAEVLAAAPAVIEITGAIPGDPFTVTVSCNNKADDAAVNGKISVTTPTAASGTVNFGKMFEAAMYLDVQSGQPRLSMATRAFDGAYPVAAQAGAETILTKASPILTSVYTA